MCCIVGVAPWDGDHVGGGARGYVGLPSNEHEPAWFVGDAGSSSKVLTTPQKI